ncbi:DUF4214 domain-containing protein, partial [Halomonas sp. N3-2A]|uniref:DUF4214 domain-containing protein n=1 Tax=Halomonas sp. N3-2A TaxID=2014541 RepID=UPI000B5FF769
ETYTLTQADVGAAISVRASYTDDQGTAEAVTSGATDSIANVNDAPMGNAIITGTTTEDETLTADTSALVDEDGLGTFSYVWKADDTAITGATSSTYTLTQAEVDKAITVEVSYTDDQGTAEAVTSAATDSVANVNDAPTGGVAISGDAVEDQTLTASNTLADEDGLGAVTYQWLRDGNEITTATGETYTLTQADVGAAISVRASYTDQQGTAEAVTSAATDSVANVNDAPTGDVIITGDAVEDQTLTASNTLADEDGLGTVTYQWLRDGNEITTATGETYTLTQADVGAAISVRASYTDQQGTAEAVTSVATDSVANVNDAPTGDVIITGDAVEDQTLTASNTLADEDGLGAVTYQWLRDGNEIAAATGETYTLTQADVGAAISVRASYTDQQGTAETVTSGATDSVANVNDAPTGNVIITGDAVEDQTLTVSNTLADEDGLGAVTYQWLRDGNEITDASGETYTLTQADVGAAISVRASYTDQQGTAEALTSAATDSVANVNDAPTGGVAISGDAVEDQTLTASNTLADEDGLGTVTYQWLRDGVEITDTTGETYTLTQADVGAEISVRAGYTDQQGTAETVTSGATESVANVNDAPIGVVTISGDAVEDQTLTVSNTLADEDGLGTVTYQWLRDGTEITDASGETYTLTQADVGAAISVRASYTDDQGTAEAVMSAATDSVANVNDAPTGDVIITGDAIEDETLTADTSALADEDGLGAFSYVWKADDTAITGATSSTYTLTQAEVGKAITVEVSYTDDQGTAEAVTSAATDSVANVNDAPTGDVIITGDAVEDQTLTASNTLADEDGLGTVTYQWLRDGNEITTATGETYTLTQADVGAAISVRASYTDQQGTAEAVTSAATDSVANVNDAPTGDVIITGDAVEDQTLTASNTLADEDGLGTVTYQWLRDGNEITTATGETYTLTQADVGTAISVRASYTDQQGTAEAATSAATESVANVNDAPTGVVTISGDAVEDQTLTASNTLADEDGLGTVTYQWLRDGNEITTATGETYTLTQADVSTAISVRASYTDQQGTAETLTSMPTSAISANPDSDNDGISNEDENRVPSLDGSTTGDGNGDGISDAEQSNVSSTPFLLTPTAVSNPEDAPEAFITLTSNGSRDAESDDDLLTLRNVRQLDAPNDRPDDLDMPFGLIAFEADIETVGGSNVFSLFVADDVEANGYWKQNAAGDWVNLASAAFGGSLTNEGNKLRFDFVIEDGGEFDSDGAANGVIVDPGAIGFRLPETPEDPEPIPDVDDGGVNSAPIARDDEFSSRFGWLLRGNLLEDNGNGIDQEVDGDDFSITDIDGQEILFDTALVLSSGATLTVQENGDFLYDQRGAFVPSQEVDRVSDIFEYSIEDSQGASSTATVSVELGDVTDTVEISVLHALYKVAFDREADATGLNYWSGVRENGVSMFDIADFFIESEEFTDDHGSSFSDDDYLTLLYANAFDRAPDADGFAYWSDVLEEPTVDHGDVMTYFATSEEMQVKHLAEGFIFA